MASAKARVLRRRYWRLEAAVRLLVEFTGKPRDEVDVAVDALAERLQKEAGELR